MIVSVMPDELVLHRVVSFTAISDFVLRVEFEDGTHQVIDFEPILSGPVFGPLRQPNLFKEVQLDTDFGALVWPNGADIDPMVLYDWPAYVDGIVARRHALTLPER